MTTWLPAAEAAHLEGLSAAHLRRLANNGKFGETRRETSGRNGKALFIAAERLSAEARARFYIAHPHLAPTSKRVGGEQPQSILSYERATAAQRERADVRRAAVIAYEVFLEEWRDRRGVTRAKERWVEQYKLTHIAVGKLSVDSIERWRAAFQADGVDGLVDGNDGRARRGKVSIPRAALNFFVARYLDKDAPPSIARAIEETRFAAYDSGWRLPEADDAFYRYVRDHVPTAVKLARRDAVDSPSKFLPYVSRAMEVPYRTLQSDHHIADVFVNCEGTVCGDQGCRSGHRPWFTPIYDVGSRKIISYQISLEVPNSERILRALYRAIVKEGLPERFYCDNGKDFKKAAEWKGIDSASEDFLGRRFRSLGMDVVFARPYNAQAKAVERFFGTLVDRRWRGSEGYAGRLGQRSERTQHLCKNPHLLPPFSQFCQGLDAAIDIYNNTPHRGEGMNGRTPAEAFAEGRIPRREPDSFAFRLVFWRTEIRTLDRNGVRAGNLTYTPIDPDATVTVNYLRERVKVLINPSDVSRAILCSLDEEFLCEARVYELATHDTRDAITQSTLDRVGRAKKAIRKEITRFANAGERPVRRFKELDFLRALMREQTRCREQERQLVAAGADAVTVVLPAYSRIARDYDAAQAADDPFGGLSADDRALAESVPPLTQERVDELLAERSSVPDLRLVNFSDEEREHITRERERVERQRKADAELCAVRGCTSPRTRVIDEAEECGPHWLELYGDEQPPGVTDHLRQAMKEEQR